jgi:4-hydroxy-tetrahydrodipicolinate reductase
MGSTVCRTVAADPELELVAAVDPGAVGGLVEGVAIAKELRAFADAGAEVVVDFTVADAARTTVPWLAMHGIHGVVGTTGLTADDLALFAQEFGGGGPNCVVAPNFAISAVVMMRCAEIAAPFFDTAEVIELHHDGKADAPSSTAITTVERMAAASDEWAPDPTRTEVIAGARGGAGAAGIHIHSVRMRGMVAHQEVILGARGQSLTIRQDSYDRESFMPGVLLACKRIADHPGLTVGLETLLGL